MTTTERLTHSPEPWRHDPADGAILIAGSIDRPVAIAEVFYVGGAENANARLMRAAPEMRKLLTMASHALRSYQYGNASTDLAGDSAEIIDALLARIDGDESAASRAAEHGAPTDSTGRPDRPHGKEN